MRWMIYCFVLFTISVAYSDKALRLQQAKTAHQPLELSDAQVTALAALSDRAHIDAALDKILVPRVVGTPGHTRVGDYIVNEMVKLGWDVEQDIFADRTPVFGKLNFRNIIARLNPDAERYLVLACHYDSKYTREHVFVVLNTDSFAYPDQKGFQQDGATDSAVPCAMMLNLAKVMAKSLEAVRPRCDVSLALLFFDGEEAFRQWGPTDSIYGARHLARRWQNTPYPEHSEDTNHLHRIDILVLLDLLGAPDPVFFSYFPATERWHARLAAAEQRLAALGQLTAYSRGKPEQTYFRLRSTRSYIEDDHIPFLRRSVNVLHVIPNPFPEVWHRAEDDRTALDFNTIDNLNKILRVFVAEYLHLAP